MSGDFKHGLFNCCDDTSDCVLAAFCPCIYASIAAHNANQGIGVTIMQCLLYPCLIPIMRNQARMKKGIAGGIVGDLVYGWCCPCCASIQIKREFDT